MRTDDRRLGRGLQALLGDYGGEPAAPRTDSGATGEIPVRAIAPNPFQPRRAFKGEELDELAASIRANGLLQPVTVRRTPSGSGYELVAGERRLRAVRQLGWSDVPAQVREVDDRTLLVLALVENIQREALGPLEEAEGYHVLRETFGYTQQEIADAVGKSRPAVANALRLRSLPPSVRRFVEEGVLSAGHARSLLPVKDAIRAADLAREAVAASWPVRELERRVGAESKKGKGASAEPEPKPRDPAIDVLEEALGDHLGARVAIQWKGEGRGAVRISFSGVRDLERVFAAVTGREASAVVS